MKQPGIGKSEGARLDHSKNCKKVHGARAGGPESHARQGHSSCLGLAHIVSEPGQCHWETGVSVVSPVLRRHQRVSWERGRGDGENNGGEAEGS